MAKKLKTKPAEAKVTVTPAAAGGNSVAALKQYIEQIEKLEEEKRGVGEHIRDVFTVAKANGFDAQTMRAILKERKLTREAAEERRYLYETYARALGMLPEAE